MQKSFLIHLTTLMDWLLKRIKMGDGFGFHKEDFRELVFLTDRAARKPLNLFMG